MLSTAARNPLIVPALVILDKLMSLFKPTGHGTARFQVCSDKSLHHKETVLTFSIHKFETGEQFIDRVRANAEGDDIIEFRFREGVITAASLIRQEDLPIRLEPGETLEAFVGRVKAYKGRMPQA